MYETYYRLSADPFRLSPDPRFCFEHPSFSRARKYMQYALRRAEGFIMVTGRPGTGKTTLVESLLSGLAGGGPVAARLVTAQLGPDELLRKVAYSFGLNVGGLDKATLLLHLERFLTQQARTGRGALLVIDEAQGLGASSLEELRLLTNLQENARPILQIFLVGQEELRDIVQHPELEQFHQRLIAACHLRPLDAEETRAYVEHRLRRVGWRGDPALTSDAFQLVHRFSAGVPRRINQVCSRLLLHGAAEDRHRLDGRDALAVIEDLRAELLAPADMAETDELRDLLASLPADPEPEPPVPAPAPAAAEPSPAPPAPPGDPESLAGALAAVSRTASVAPPEPSGVAHAPAPEPPRVRTAAATEATVQLSESDLRLPGRAPGPPAPEPARRPAYRPIAPERPRRRLFSRVLPPLLVVAAAVPLAFALSPGLASKLRTGLAEWVAEVQPAPTPAGSLTSGPVARRADPAAPSAAGDGVPEAPRATASAAGPPAAVGREYPAQPATMPTAPLRPQPAPGPAVEAPLPAGEGEAPAPRSGPVRPPEASPATALAAQPPPSAEPPAAAAEAASAAAERGTPSTPPQDPAPSAVAPAAGPEAAPARLADTAREQGGPERELARLGLYSRRLTDGTVHVNLRRLVPFDFNSADVRPESRPFLDRLAEVLRQLDGFVVRIVGLTDDSGTRDYNAQLSRRRAEAVAAYLRQQGVPADRLRAEGRGAGEPPAEVSGIADGGADRRRIELYIQPLANGRA